MTLEEMGATGNLGLSQIALNPVVQGAMGGLAVSAAQHASVEVGMPHTAIRGCSTILSSLALGVWQCQQPTEACWGHCNQGLHHNVGQLCICILLQ